MMKAIRRPPKARSWFSHAIFLALFLLCVSMVKSSSSSSSHDQQKGCSVKQIVPKYSLTNPEIMLCGGLSTALTDLALFPLDTIKIIQQSLGPTGKSMLCTLNNIIKERGVNRLYSGSAAYSLIDGTGAALFFLTFETLKGLLTKESKEPIVGTSALLAAGASFAVSSVLIVPGELVKTRSQTFMYSSPITCVRDILSDGSKGGNFNFRNMYTGYFTTVFRDLPYFALNLAFYETIRSKFQRATEENPKLASVVDLAAGAGSGLLAAALTTPMDVMATRLMCQKQHTLISAVDCPLVPYKGLVDCATRMFKEEGVSSFLSGLTARCLWMGPFSAISLSLYELLKRRLAAHKEYQACLANPTESAISSSSLHKTKSKSIHSTFTSLIQNRQRTRFF